VTVGRPASELQRGTTDRLESVEDPPEVTPLRPGSRIVMELRSHPASAGAARRRVDAALRQWGCEAVRNAVLVVTSELVTNAIVHGRSSFTVTVTRKLDAVRVEVRDRCRGRPILTSVSVDATHGRGLQLVDRLSSAWNSYGTADDGKVVWVEVRVPLSPGHQQSLTFPPHGSVPVECDAALRLAAQRLGT